MARTTAAELLENVNGINSRYRALCRTETDIELFNFLNRELPPAYKKLTEAHKLTVSRPDYKTAVHLYNGLYAEAVEICAGHGYELDNAIQRIKE